MTAVHWNREELLVSYRPSLPADIAREIVADTLASGRVPPLALNDDRRERRHLSILGRLWCGVHWRPEGAYWIVFVGSQCLVGRCPPAAGQSGR
jgi:hypothetical protein